MLTHQDLGIAASEYEAVANNIADYFGSEQSYDRFRTHGRPIRIEELEQIRGMRVRRLEADDDVQDAVLSIYHALDFTFGGHAMKIIENHLGARYVRIRMPMALQMPSPSPPP